MASFICHLFGRDEHQATEKVDFPVEVNSFEAGVGIRDSKRSNMIKKQIMNAILKQSDLGGSLEQQFIHICR
jgi:hypothetical protein